jgi:hypothetical protein
MTSSHQNLKIPFTLSRIDCTTMGDNGTAYFSHYQANSMMPTTLQVDSGTVKLDQFDPNNKNALKGSFDLTFGGSKVQGTINALDCDL